MKILVAFETERKPFDVPAVIQADTTLVESTLVRPHDGQHSAGSAGAGSARLRESGGQSGQCSWCTLVHPQQLACSLAAPRGVGIDGASAPRSARRKNVRNGSVREEFARSSARRPRAGAPAGKGNGSRFGLDPVRIQLTCCSSPQGDHLSQKAA